MPRNKNLQSSSTGGRVSPIVGLFRAASNNPAHVVDSSAVHAHGLHAELGRGAMDRIAAADERKLIRS